MTAYDVRISDWSSDVCSSDLVLLVPAAAVLPDYRGRGRRRAGRRHADGGTDHDRGGRGTARPGGADRLRADQPDLPPPRPPAAVALRPAPAMMTPQDWRRERNAGPRARAFLPPGLSQPSGPLPPRPRSSVPTAPTP